MLNWFMIHGIKKQIRTETKYVRKIRDSLGSCKIAANEYREKHPGVKNIEDETCADAEEMKQIADLYEAELELCIHLYNTVLASANGFIKSNKTRDKLLSMIQFELKPEIEWLNEELVSIGGGN